MTKLFDYKTVATIVSERLFDDLDKVHELMTFMTGEIVTPGNASLLTQLCRDYFMASYPALQDVDLSECSPQYYDCYVADFNDLLGQAVPVPQNAAARFL